tara:strand:+ start:792 stop:1421 length:630 start_codon:yes stop_codon:yes gene_type:complete
MESTLKMDPTKMSNTEFLNSISDEKIGFFPKVEATQSQGAYFKVSAIGKAYSNPSKIRILGAFIDDSMIEGWRAFNTSGMPMRKKTKDEIDLSQLGKNNFGQDEKPIRFWAFPVYVFDDNSVQICEIHQVGLMRELERLGNDRNWGDPRLYDVSIMKTGSGNRTAYQVTPSRSQFPQEHADSVGKAIDQIDLQKLFVNEDPFLTSPNNA